MVKGIDVSKWNGNIDWRRVSNAGIKFAMIRAAYGSKNGNITTDKMFARNVQEAHNEGLHVGIYLYSYAKNESAAQNEAKNLVKLIEPYRKCIDYPIAYDLEDRSQLSLGKYVCGKMVLAFCNIIKNAGYNAILYTNPSWLTSYVIVPNDIPIWLAHWNVRKPSYKCDMWQYSSTGKVDGIRGNVDMDISYISEEQKELEEFEKDIYYLRDKGRLNSPDLWINICKGKLIVSKENIKALIHKWKIDVEKQRNA